MKIADVLRQLADTIDQHENPATPDEKIQNPAELNPVPVGQPVDTVSDTSTESNDNVMIPPLQLKTELLKRAVGVDNVYDDGGAREDQAQDNSESDIQVLKKHAGIASVSELSNEEPLDD